MKTQNRTLTLCTVVVAAAVAGFATPASAQETSTTTTTTTTEAPPPVRHVGRTSGDVGSGGLGVGAAAFLSGLAGPEVVYDFGVWHLQGLLAFDRRPAGGAMNPTISVLQFGVSGWYHLHIGESSDFSLGGGFGLFNASSSAAGTDSATGFEFEPGALIRAFVTPNVAVFGQMGFVLAFGDRVGPTQQQLALAGQITAGFGVTYFFR
jgi:hypothetical protein